jgi:hypothetical protein
MGDRLLRGRAGAQPRGNMVLHCPCSFMFATLHATELMTLPASRQHCYLLAQTFLFEDFETRFLLAQTCGSQRGYINEKRFLKKFLVGSHSALAFSSF